MAKKPLSEKLTAEIDLIRQTALKLRDEMSSQTMKATLDLALADLDEIPRLFDSEDYMRQALIFPKARIRMVVEAREKFGPNVQAIPGDL